MRLLYRRLVSWTLLALALLLILTGLGITEFRTVEPLTLGLLGKAFSFQLHSLLWIPFIIVLFLHVALSCRVRRWSPGSAAGEESIAFPPSGLQATVQGNRLPPDGIRDHTAVPGKLG